MAWTRRGGALAAVVVIGACGGSGGGSGSSSSGSSTTDPDSSEGASHDSGAPTCEDGMPFEARFYGSDLDGVIDGMPCMVEAIEPAEDPTTKLLSIGLACDAAHGFVTIAVDNGLLDAAGLTLATDLAVGDAVIFDRFFAPGTGTDRAHDWSSLRRDDGTLVIAGIDGSHLGDAPADALAMVSPLVASALDPCPSAQPPAPCELWDDGIAVELDGATQTLVAGQAPKLGAFRVIAGRAMRYDLPAEGCDPVDGVDVPPAIYQLVAWREP